MKTAMRLSWVWWASLSIGCGDDGGGSATDSGTGTGTADGSGPTAGPGSATASSGPTGGPTAGTETSADSGSTGNPDGVGKWERVVLEFTDPTVEGNPFETVLDATFTHQGTGAELVVPAYYDGNDTWRVGFMPTEIGTWDWVTTSADADLDGQAGAVDVIESGRPGLLAADADNPTKWKRADGDHVVPVGIFLSAMLDDATDQEFEAMADFLRDNELKVINFRISEHDLAFSDVGALQMDLALWQRLEQRMEVLDERDIGIDIMLYTDDAGQPSFGPMSEAEALLIRYTIARLAGFPAVFFNTGIDLAEYRDQDWVNWFGDQVRAIDPYGHPVSSRYGSGSGNLRMVGQTYNSVGDRNSTIAGLLAAYGAEPIPAHNDDNWSEDLDLGNINGHSADDIRRGAWKATIAGGVGFHVRHNTPNCFGGLLTECDRYFDVAQLADQLDAEPWLALVNPFVRDKFGAAYGQMDPAPSLVDGSGGKWALADAGPANMLFFLVGTNDNWDGGDGGAITLQLGGVAGTFNATWFDPRTGTEMDAGTVDGGGNTSLDPPTADDWVLLLQR